MNVTPVAGDSNGLYDTWIYYASTSTATGVTFTSDGRYVGQALVLDNLITDGSGNIVSGHANDEQERGSFVASGSNITFTPMQATCDGSYPIYSASYVLDGDRLTLSLPSSIVAFTRVKDAGMSAFAITLGCFTASGFVQQPLAPVGP